MFATAEIQAHVREETTRYAPKQVYAQLVAALAGGFSVKTRTCRIATTDQAQPQQLDWWDGPLVETEGARR
jgi:hypothetical protein